MAVKKLSDVEPAGDDLKALPFPKKNQELQEEMASLNTKLLWKVFAQQNVTLCHSMSSDSLENPAVL